jgi:toxin ParE1/3/4
LTLKNSSRNFELAKKYKVKILVTAQKDLANIWDYISQDNPMNAIEFIHEIEKRILNLNQYPERNPIIPECQILQTKKYHHSIYKQYRIVYRFDSGNVYVIRVFHGSKLLDITTEK